MAQGRPQVTRIVLVRTDDQWTRLRPGSKGLLVGRRTTPFGDDIVDVSWEDGSSLSLIAGVDEWHEDDE